MIGKKTMRSKQYSETARTLLLVAKRVADEAIANRLRSLAGQYEQRAALCSRAEAARDVEISSVKGW